MRSNSGLLELVGVEAGDEAGLVGVSVVVLTFGLDKGFFGEVAVLGLESGVVEAGVLLVTRVLESGISGGTFFSGWCGIDQSGIFFLFDNALVVTRDTYYNMYVRCYFDSIGRA